MNRPQNGPSPTGRDYSCCSQSAKEADSLRNLQNTLQLQLPDRTFHNFEASFMKLRNVDSSSLRLWNLENFVLVKHWKVCCLSSVTPDTFHGLTEAFSAVASSLAIKISFNSWYLNRTHKNKGNCERQEGRKPFIWFSAVMAGFSKRWRMLWPKYRNSLPSQEMDARS